MTFVLDHGARRHRNTGRDDDVDMARDRALITRAQAGDRSAFDELYLHYSRRLYRLCLRRLSDAHEAEDVAQEAFVRAWRALPRFCGERRFYPWLSVIAANLCTDVLRKRSRSTPVAQFFGADPDSGEEVENRLLHEVDAAMVGEALTKLTERHRRILSLREGEGMTYQAIADHEGVAVSAVETLLWRARQALKREFCALAEAAEGRGAALVGLGIVGRLLARMLRLPVRAAKRLAHFTPASAVLTVASVSALGAVAIGVTHAAVPAAAPGPAHAAALGSHALGDLPGVTGAAPGAPGAIADDRGVGGGAAASADGGAGNPAGTDATVPGGSSGVTGPGGNSDGSPFFSLGPGAGGAAAANGVGGSAAGLGGLLAALSSGSVGSTLSTVTDAASGASGTVGAAVSSITPGVSAAGTSAGSVGSTLSTVTKAASGAAGTVSGVTKTASAAAGSVGSMLPTVTTVASGAAATVSGVTTSVAGGAPTGSSTVPPVLGGGSPSSGGGVSGSVLPTSPAPSSGGGAPLPVGIGGLFG